MARKLRLTFALSNGKDYTIALADPKATSDLTPSVLNDAMTGMIQSDAISIGSGVSAATLAEAKSADIYETTITELPLE